MSDPIEFHENNHQSLLVSINGVMATADQLEQVLMLLNYDPEVKALLNAKVATILGGKKDA